MSKRAFMPLYIGDYLADTGHLSTTQHGAYLLLMMHYWRVGELPDDDKQMAAITKLPLRLWLDCRETLQAFFYDGWQHKRIDQEIGKMLKATTKRAAAGQKGGLRSAMNRMLLEDKAGRSNATAMLQQCSSKGMLQPGSTTNTNTKNISSSSSVAAREKGSARSLGQVSPELEAILAKGRA